MLTLINTVPEVNEHIILPVARQVLNKIVDEIGMRSHINDRVFVMTDGMVPGGVLDKNNNPAIPEDRVEARLIPNIHPINNKWEAGTAITQIDNFIITKSNQRPYDRMPFDPKANTPKVPILWDKDVCTALVEDTLPCSVTLDTTWRFTEITAGHEAMQRILSVYTNGEMICDIDLVYDYPISSPILQVLLGIARLKGLKDKEFIPWLKEKSKGLISLSVYRDLSQQSRELVINKNHFRTIFQIEMSQEAPQAADQYVEFTSQITVQFARANQLILQYPICIQNQPVPRAMVPLDEEERYKQDLKEFWRDRDTNNYYKKLYPDGPRFKPFQYPWWDNWKLPGSSKVASMGHIMWLSCLFTIDNPEDPEAVTKINLKTDLPHCTINPVVLKKLKRLKGMALDFYYEYGVYVFVDDVQVNSNLLSFDGETLTIRCKRIDRVYRLVLTKRRAPKIVEEDGGTKVPIDEEEKEYNDQYGEGGYDDGNGGMTPPKDVDINFDVVDQSNTDYGIKEEKYGNPNIFWVGLVTIRATK
jgi:hypothetical protein